MKCIKDDKNFITLEKEETLVINGGGFWSFVGHPAFSTALSVVATATCAVAFAVIGAPVAVTVGATAVTAAVTGKITTDQWKEKPNK